MKNVTTEKIVADARKKRRTRGMLVIITLVVLALGLCIAMLLMGNTIYSPKTVWKVLLGEDIQGATFAIKTLCVPRLFAAVLSGFAFGMAGSVFQTMLRNPLASPNVIGVTSGSSAAAVFCILILKVTGPIASFIAVATGLVTTGIIYLLSHGGGFSGGKLILIGIGVQAMLNSLISYFLLKAATNDVPTAMRWLTGSLNNIQQTDLIPLAISVLICCPIIILYSRSLSILELGKSFSITLGLSIQSTQILLIISAVFLLSFATATTGPIAFVAFLSGPIAKRLVGTGFR